MEDQVEEVKRKADIVGVVGQYVALKKIGRHHKGLCPFHSEKTASFMVNEEMGLYKCFGCGAGGDVIKFLMEIEGIEFMEALERLAERAGVKLKPRKIEQGGDKQKLLEIMDLTARYYHWLLTSGKSGEKARQYLKERKINEKLIETFNLGYALPGWDNLVNYLTKKKGYAEALLEKAGLVGRTEKGRVYDKFRGRIMFPLQDSAGKVVGFSGRILPSEAKESEPKYLNSPETEIYHKGRMLYAFYQARQAIREKKRVVLVEGHLDLISSFGAGVTETVAVGGTALTEDQVEMMARLATTIYLSLDADEAGTAAVKRAVEIAEKRGLEIKVVQIEGGKDPDEIASKYPNKWREMASEGVDFYEFVMKKALEKYDSKEVSGIRKITEEVVPFLAKIENGVIREVWAKKLAEKLEADIQTVKNEIERYKSGKSWEKKTTKTAEAETEVKTDRLKRKLVEGVLLFPEVKDKLRGWIKKLTPEGVYGKTLWWLVSHEETEPAEIREKIPAELKECVEEAYMGENGETDAKSVLGVAVQVLREAIREKRKKLIEELKEAEEGGLDQKEDDLARELSDLDREESRILILLD